MINNVVLIGRLTRDLDKPEKVTIPQLIAEKVKYCKETDGYSLFHAMDYCYNFKECADWLERNEEVFARAWLDGYEVETEKRYLVKLIGTSPKSSFLKYDEFEKIWYLGLKHNKEDIRAHHTRKELEEAGFGEVFNSPLFEVVEVE